MIYLVRLPIHGYGYFTDFLCTYEPYKCKKMIPLWLTDALDDVIQADADKTKQQRINYENIRLDVTMLINGIDEWHLRQPSIQTVKRANVFRFINELPLLIFNWETVFNTLKNYRKSVVILIQRYLNLNRFQFVVSLIIIKVKCVK